MLSFLLHAGFLTGMNQTASPDAMNPRRQADVRLQVQLSPRPRAEKAPALPLPVAQPAKASANQVTPPRFIVEPDLSLLQDIPLSMGGKVHFRLRVSALGTVSAIEVLGHDPLPSELLDGLKNRLSETMLRPAEQDGRAVDSTLDITVGFEPGNAP